jgi:hypothetical protein
MYIVCVRRYEVGTLRQLVVLTKRAVRPCRVGPVAPHAVPVARADVRTATCAAIAQVHTCLADKGQFRARLAASVFVGALVGAIYLRLTSEQQYAQAWPQQTHARFSALAPSTGVHTSHPVRHVQSRTIWSEPPSRAIGDREPRLCGDAPYSSHCSF